jgi:hypothetical protein
LKTTLPVLNVTLSVTAILAAAAVVAGIGAVECGTRGWETSTGRVRVRARVRVSLRCPRSKATFGVHTIRGTLFF